MPPFGEMQNSSGTIHRYYLYRESLICHAKYVAPRLSNLNNAHRHFSGSSEKYFASPSIDDNRHDSLLLRPTATPPGYVPNHRQTIQTILQMKCMDPVRAHNTQHLKDATPTDSGLDVRSITRFKTKCIRPGSVF